MYCTGDCWVIYTVIILNQFGVRSSHSTSQSVSAFIRHVLLNLENVKPALGVSYVLFSVFDHEKRKVLGANLKGCGGEGFHLLSSDLGL